MMGAGVLALALGVFLSAAYATPVVSEVLRFKAEVPTGWTATRDGREFSSPTRDAATPKGIEVAFEPGLAVDAGTLIRERSEAQSRGPGRASVSPFGSRGRWRTVSARLKRDGGVLLVWAAREAPGGAFLVTLYAPETDARGALADLHAFLDSFEPAFREPTFKRGKCGEGCSLDLPADWETRSEAGRTTAYGPSASGGRPLLRVERVAKDGRTPTARSFLDAQSARPGVKAGPIQRQGSRGGAVLVMEQRRVSAPDLVETSVQAVPVLTAWSVFDTGGALITVSCESPEGAYPDCVAAQRRATKSLVWGR